MGNIWSGPADGDEDGQTAGANCSLYKYPPKAENYFGSHFLLGGERFEIAQPESFLFGDNADLNWIGPQASQYYPANQTAPEITRTLNCLINVRRDSIKFVRDRSHEESTNADEPSTLPSLAESDETDDDESKNDENPVDTANSTDSKPAKTSPNLADLPSVVVKSAASSLAGTLRLGLRKNSSNNNNNGANSESANADNPAVKTEPFRYKISFTLDADCPCEVVIHHFAYEDLETGCIVSKSPEMSSKAYYFNVGPDQTFVTPEHVFEPAQHESAAMLADGKTFAIVIECAAKNGTQTQVSMCVVERSAEGQGYILKAARQKLKVDGLWYLLQEIYGIENKHLNEAMFEGRANECIICLSDLRDVLILPCRHLCLCNACAEALRHKSSNCPICRSPFRALLRIRTLRKLSHKEKSDGTKSIATIRTAGGITTASTSRHAAATNKYERMSLIEALNGPVDTTQTVPDQPFMNRPLAGANNQSTQSQSDQNEANERLERHTTAAAALQSANAAAAAAALANGGGRTTAASAASAVMNAIRGDRRHHAKHKTRPVAPIQKVLTANSSSHSMDSGVGTSVSAGANGIGDVPVPVDETPRTKRDIDVELGNHAEDLDEEMKGVQLTNGSDLKAFTSSRVGRPTSIVLETQDSPSSCTSDDESDVSPQLPAVKGKSYHLMPMSRATTATTVAGSDDFAMANINNNRNNNNNNNATTTVEDVDDDEYEEADSDNDHAAENGGRFENSNFPPIMNHGGVVNVCVDAECADEQLPQPHSPLCHSLDLPKPPDSERSDQSVNSGSALLARERDNSVVVTDLEP